MPAQALAVIHVGTQFAMQPIYVGLCGSPSRSLIAAPPAALRDDGLVRGRQDRAELDASAR
jgi:hypothetical protein